ncbi:MAG: C39 family peptidase [bacterium]
MIEILAAAALTVFQASYILDPVPQQKGAVYLPRPQQETHFPETHKVEPFSETKWRAVVRQKYDYSCGSAAISTLLKYYLGEDISELNAMRGMLRHGERQKIIQRQGFSLLDMKQYVSFLGYRSGGFRAELSDLKGLDRPVILPIQYGGFKHFVVLRDISSGRAFIADPAFGNITLTLQRFSNIWEPDVLFMAYRGNKTAVNKLAIEDQDLRYVTVTYPDNRDFILDQYRQQELLEQSINRATQNFKYF